MRALPTPSLVSAASSALCLIKPRICYLFGRVVSISKFAAADRLQGLCVRSPPVLRETRRLLASVLTGLALGFTSGVAPGPFHAYLVSQSIRRGWVATLPAAFAPLISDVLLVSTVLLILATTPPWFLRALQGGGGLFLLVLAWRALRAFRAGPTELEESGGEGGRQSMLQATLVNIFNPNPWIFWTVVAGPLLLDLWSKDPSHGVGFLVSFYTTLIAVFVLFVVLFSTFRRFGPRAVHVANAVSAAVFLGLAMFQFAQVFR